MTRLLGFMKLKAHPKLRLAHIKERDYKVYVGALLGGHTQLDQIKWHPMQTIKKID